MIGALGRGAEERAYRLRRQLAIPDRLRDLHAGVVEHVDALDGGIILYHAAEDVVERRRAGVREVAENAVEDHVEAPVLQLAAVDRAHHVALELASQRLDLGRGPLEPS